MFISVRRLPNRTHHAQQLGIVRGPPQRELTAGGLIFAQEFPAGGRCGQSDSRGQDIRGSNVGDRERVNALLVDVCRGRADHPQLAPELPANLIDEVVEAARYHRIAPLTHVALRRTGPAIAAALKVDRDRAFWHHARVLAILGDLDATLNGIAWLVFKGPVLSELAHPQPGLRSYKDLDLLVDPGDLRAAATRLLDSGWTVIDSNETLRAPELSGELRLADPRRVLTDLHWSMVVTLRRRRTFPVPTEQLLRRRRRVDAGPSQIWALDSVDSLVHVCLHAALSGATRLLHLLDADQLARQMEDWDLVAERSREWGATAQTALVLGRASRLLDTPVPIDLHARLGLSSALGSAMAGVDRLWPIEGLRQDESIPRLVARAVRPGLGATAASVVRSMLVGVLHRARPKAVASPRIPADRDVIDSYFSAVEATTRPAALPS